MPSRTIVSRARVDFGRWWGALALASLTVGCGGDGDYYFLNEIKGEGNTVLLEFVYTCGNIDVTWAGSFGALPQYEAELLVKHDDLGRDCAEDPREVSFDVGSLKESFRREHPWPTPLGVRVAPFEEEQGAMCLRDLFQAEPFKGQRCK